MKLKKFWAGLGILVFFAFGLLISKMSPEHAELASSRAFSWALGGYLPDQPNQKIYVIIGKQRILSISQTKPRGGLVIESDGWIFPGLMNLHNHHKYNIFPLWPEAKGQFTNRFEWRDRYPPYKDYASFNLRALPPTHTCAAIRWAELKELVSGITTTQGVTGSESECAANFGPRNVEIVGEMKEETKALSMIDTIAPELMGSVYLRSIKPLMVEKKMSYSQAVQTVLEREGVFQWLEKYQTLPQNLSSALILTVGKDFSVPANSQSPADFQKIIPQLKAHLIAQKWATAKDAERKVQQIQSWIFGSARQEGYLTIEIPTTSVWEDSNAMRLFDSWGIFVIPESIRSYANFEAYLRPRMLKQGPAANAVLLHLSEGSRTDPFSQAEYSLLHELGMNQKNSVIIHGVGLSPEQLDLMVQIGQSLVWSPFSNLLLYGDTIPVGEVMKRKINWTMGTDWAPSGSKNLFDEIRIAKDYLAATKEASISDKEWAQAVTVNAAKALKLQDRFGMIAPNYQADLVVIERRSRQPYQDFVSSNEKNVELVSVKGNPVYGQKDWVEAFAKEWQDPEAPELINACGKTKALRIMAARPADLDLRTVEATKRTLNELLAKYREQVEKTEPAKAKLLVQLDPLFSCEDLNYQKVVQNFIQETWPQMKKERTKIRSQSGLVEYNPLSPNSSAEASEK